VQFPVNNITDNGYRCPKGHYCPAGTSVPIACDVGNYQPKLCMTCQQGAITQAHPSCSTTTQCTTPYYASIIDACKADPECKKFDPDGPLDGFTACKTDNCNSCNAEVNWTGALAPSLALLAVTLLAIASGL
jgi:hypothetical protein